MYDISISGYKVTKSTWGSISATNMPRKISVCASTEKRKKLVPVGAALDQEGLRQIIRKLAESGAEYISVRATVDEPTGAHWQIYYKLQKRNDNDVQI